MADGLLSIFKALSSIAMPHQMLLLLIIAALDRKDCKLDIQDLYQPEPTRARRQPSAWVTLLSSGHLKVITQFSWPRLEALRASLLHFWQTDPSLQYPMVSLCFLIAEHGAWQQQRDLVWIQCTVKHSPKAHFHFQ